MRTPSPRFGEAEQLDQVALGLEVVEQLADALEVLQARRRPRAGWRGRARSGSCWLVARRRTRWRAPPRPRRCVSASSSALARRPCSVSIAALRLGQRPAADVRVEVVRRPRCRLRRRQPGRQVDDAVLDVAVLADQHDQRLARLRAGRTRRASARLPACRPAPRRRSATGPESIWPASSSTCSTASSPPDAELRLDAGGAPRRSGRRPRAGRRRTSASRLRVGSRPAEVCGA